MSIFGKFDQKYLRRRIALRTKKSLESSREMRNLYKMIPERYHVLIEGVPVCFLNPSLAEEKEVSPLYLEELKKLHVSKIELFEMMELADPDNLPSEDFFSKCVATLEDIEFLMQRAWGFSEDRNYHTWWYQAPHCICPKLDNAERFGINQRITREGCPLHGKKKESSKDAESESVEPATA